MDVIAALRRIRACESEAAAQVVFEALVREQVGRMYGQPIFVLHPDDPNLRDLDGQLVLLQRTLPRYSDQKANG